ncbi:hypothetical protein [Arachidicoccus soli]|uniref:Uncharacterized protein n=1 Tax=Arachidicoccus soli TaxID=2341117 RepID=A0A386HN13_9BACT|nr:hypothetical protein [Arachidicoccus soli]AYD47006.1 hypothetical protein D6B99_04885 [Arachidicoccus soli]
MADKKYISSQKMLTEEEKLIEYLNNNLPKPDAQKIEEAYAESDFTKDALEGLRAFKHPKSLTRNVSRLNKSLHRSIDDKSPRRSPAFSQLIWFIVAVILILLLLIAGYAVIKLRI